MAVLGSSVMNLLDWAKRLDPNGQVADVVELLSQDNPILDDMPFMEGNLPTGHQTTVRTGLPTVAWRLINSGVAPSKSTTAQVVEACGQLEAWSEVDVKLANLGGNPAAVRLSEAKAFLEALKQEMAATLIYGNSGTAPEEFTGLSPRYATISGATNRQNVLSGGGSDSDNSSVWLICWGEQSIHGIFPKGSKAGIEHKDLGEVTVEVSAGVGGNRMRAYQEFWKWECGVALKDWRYVVRICNIDVSNLVAKSSAADLFDLMIKATHRIPHPGMGKGVFYMNRSCFQMLDIQGRDAVGSGGQLGYKDVAGKRIPMFREYPVKVLDCLLETESTVS